MEIRGGAETIQNTAFFGSGLNIEKSPEYMRTFVDSQTPVKDHQLTLVLKLERSKIMVIVKDNVN